MVDREQAIEKTARAVVDAWRSGHIKSRAGSKMQDLRYALALPPQPVQITDEMVDVALEVFGAPSWVSPRTEMRACLEEFFAALSLLREPGGE